MKSLRIIILFAIISNLQATSSLFDSLYLEERVALEQAKYTGWVMDWFDYDPELPFTREQRIRYGYFEENKTVEFKGNILYLQGLGDSMLNHKPLFDFLSDRGYRILSFDYQGQGGSGGSMNHTRIRDRYFPELEIKVLAKRNWEKFARIEESKESDRIVLGWSTGGLAAYSLAEEEWADRVILLAPGISPKAIFGDKFKIIKDTLTRREFVPSQDPHLDPIRPSTPIKAPLFSLNLLATAKASQKWKISSDIEGIAFFGGEKSDRYVFARKSIRILKRNAKHFSVHQYKDAYHELDNEISEVSEDLFHKIADFLDRTHPDKREEHEEKED